MAAVNQAIVKCNQSFRALLISQPSNTATDSSAIWNAILSMTDGWITRFVSGSRSERSVYISVFLFSSPAEVFRKEVHPLRAPILINTMPPKTPNTRPIVAEVTDRLAPSIHFNSSNTAAIPPAVPWPPDHPCSTIVPNSGDTPNTGVSISAVRSNGTAYCVKNVK